MRVATVASATRHPISSQPDRRNRFLPHPIGHEVGEVAKPADLACIAAVVSVRMRDLTHCLGASWFAKKGEYVCLALRLMCELQFLAGVQEHPRLLVHGCQCGAPPLRRTLDGRVSMRPLCKFLTGCASLSTTCAGKKMAE